MVAPASDRLQLNAYGKVILGCVLAGVATPLAGGPGYLSAGFLGAALVVVWVAMRRNARTDDERRHEDGRRQDDDAGTDDTEMKAKAMVGGAGGGDGG